MPRESIHVEDCAPPRRAFFCPHMRNEVCAAGIVDGRIDGSGHPSLRLAADLLRTK